MDSLPEPWLRGPLEGVSPLFAPTLYAFEQVREDLLKHTHALTGQHVWLRPYGLAPLGFQLRHIAGSVERLGTYLLGQELTPQQLAALQREMDPGEELTALLHKVNRALDDVERIIRATPEQSAREPRYVGRKKLPTTVIGLIIHIAEHTLRHTGQAISAAKLARAMVPESGDSAD